MNEKGKKIKNSRGSLVKSEYIKLCLVALIIFFILRLDGKTEIGKIIWFNSNGFFTF